MKVPRATEVPLSKEQLRDILEIYQNSIDSIPEEKQKPEREFWKKVSELKDKKDQEYMIWERFKKDIHNPFIREYKKRSGKYMSDVRRTKQKPAVSVFNKIAEAIFDPLNLWKGQKAKADMKKKEEERKEEEKKGPTPVI